MPDETAPNPHRNMWSVGLHAALSPLRHHASALRIARGWRRGFSGAVHIHPLSDSATQRLSDCGGLCLLLLPCLMDAMNPYYIANDHDSS